MLSILRQTIYVLTGGSLGALGVHFSRGDAPFRITFQGFHLPGVPFREAILDPTRATDTRELSRVFSEARRTLQNWVACSQKFVQASVFFCFFLGGRVEGIVWRTLHEHWIEF